MTGEGALLRMTGISCHSDSTIVIPNPPLCHSERPLSVIPNVVRNLRFPFDGWSVTTMSHRISSILDSSACAPQNDTGGGRASE